MYIKNKLKNINKKLSNNDNIKSFCNNRKNEINKIKKINQISKGYEKNIS